MEVIQLMAEKKHRGEKNPELVLQAKILDTSGPSVASATVSGAYESGDLYQVILVTNSAMQGQYCFIVWLTAYPEEVQHASRIADSACPFIFSTRC